MAIDENTYEIKFFTGDSQQFERKVQVVAGSEREAKSVFETQYGVNTHIQSLTKIRNPHNRDEAQEEHVETKVGTFASLVSLFVLTFILGGIGTFFEWPWMIIIWLVIYLLPLLGVTISTLAESTSFLRYVKIFMIWLTGLIPIIIFGYMSFRMLFR